MIADTGYPKKTTRWFWAPLVLGVVSLTVLCMVRNAAAHSSVVVVKMKDMPPSFEPREVTIHVGDTVKWENVGNSVHHATDSHEMAIKSEDVQSPGGTASFDSGFLRPGEAFTHTFTTAGVYKYVCVAHEASGMIGEITVTPSNG